MAKRNYVYKLTSSPKISASCMLLCIFTGVFAAADVVYIAANPKSVGAGLVFGVVALAVFSFAFFYRGTHIFKVYVTKEELVFKSLFETISIAASDVVAVKCGHVYGEGKFFVVKASNVPDEHKRKLRFYCTKKAEEAVKLFWNKPVDEDDYFALPPVV